ncbi:MAG: radical SAM protein [Mycoplasmatota bacterium]
MKVQVDVLLMETTRRCNMQCAHCMRGPKENVDMSFDIIDELLENIDYIYIANFVGAEPSLYIDLIEYFFKRVKEKNIGLGGFWISTNGKENQEILINVLNRAYPDMLIPSICGLSVSSTPFHEKVNRDIFKDVVFLDNSRDKSNDSTDWIADIGFAKENNVGNRVPNKTEYYYTKIDNIPDGEPIVHTNFYVSAKGGIMPISECTFKDIDESTDPIEEFFSGLKEYVKLEQETKNGYILKNQKI